MVIVVEVVLDDVVIGVEVTLALVDVDEVVLFAGVEVVVLVCDVVDVDVAAGVDEAAMTGAVGHLEGTAVARMHLPEPGRHCE